MNPDLSLNNILCLITVGISIFAFNNAELRSRFLHIPYRENHNREKYRLLTSGFIHDDFTHLLFNMITLYSFGDLVHRWFSSSEMFGSAGSIVYISFYLVAILAGNSPTYVKHKDNISYGALGASGATSAVIFVAILYNPMSQLLVFFLPMPGFIFAILFLWLSSYAAKRSIGRIDHEAHLYGALFGILFVTAFRPMVLLECFQQIILGVQGYLS